MRRKTKKMLAVEAKLGEQLEHALPRMVTENGLVGTADYIGISKAALGYWLMKFNIEIHRIAIGPGDTLEVKRRGEDLEIATPQEDEAAIRLRSEMCAAIIDILREKSPRRNKEIIAGLHARGFTRADRNIIYFLNRNRMFTKLGHGVWALSAEGDE